MQRKGTLYTILFAALVCVVCSVAVSTAAVALKPRQEENQVYYRRLNVLEATGLKKPGEKIARGRVEELFETRVKPVVIDLETGQPTDVDPAKFDPRAAVEDPALSKPAPKNPAQVQRIPKQALIYEVVGEGGSGMEMVVIPIQGKGLWSTLYGYLAVANDGNTIRGITYYQHGETPGLGGEVENPRWKALWPGRQIYRDGEPAIEVIKGAAGPPSEDPYRVDGLSGATITARGVSHMLRFWLDEQGFGPYLKRLQEQRS